MWDPDTLALFVDRRDAGRRLAAALEGEREPSLVIVGLARGGVVVAAEVAHALEAPLDVVAVRKVGHPLQPEYALGAVTPGDGVYMRAHDDLTDDEVAAAVEGARAEARLLDRRLHAEHRPLDLAGTTVAAVDDGLATGATMVAALRWARAAGAARVIAAVPVAAPVSLDLVRAEADEVVCLCAPAHFCAVGAWYGAFDPVDDEDVVHLLAENRGRVRDEARRAAGAAPGAAR